MLTIYQKVLLNYEIFLTKIRISIKICKKAILSKKNFTKVFFRFLLFPFETQSFRKIPLFSHLDPSFFIRYNRHSFYCFSGSLINSFYLCLYFFKVWCFCCCVADVKLFNKKLNELDSKTMTRRIELRSCS